jgi:D-alanyl-D-alanine endopeptidase (penicillin-binding protein 7)
VGFCSSALGAQIEQKAEQRATQENAAADRSLDTVIIARAGALNLKSAAAIVVRMDDGRALYAKNTGEVMPIASITKLMTAMVVLDSRLSLIEPITITTADIDRIKGTRSRLKVGAKLTRSRLLRLALMSSENRAAAALTRAYPGGVRAFVAAMNRKAVELGMWRSRFVEGTGLSSDNVSTARDLAIMVKGAYGYPLIREYTTEPAYAVKVAKGRTLRYRNSNRLIQNAKWDIGLSKTGYIREAGRGLVMQTVIAATPVIIVLLDSSGRLTRIRDANRIRKWIETNRLRQVTGPPES